MLKKVNSKSLENMRLTFILSASFVFGIVLQNFVFAENSQILTEAEEQKPKIEKQASVALAFESSKKKEEITEIKNIPKITETKEAVKTEVETPKEETQQKNNLLVHALISDSNPNFLPIRNLNINEIEIDTRAAFVISEDGKVLYQKNSETRLPIASLTKVMTALVVLENVNPHELITITREILETEGLAGRLVLGEEIEAESLLKLMLVVSSNDAAVAFREHLKLNDLDIIVLMNKKAEELGLQNTHFSNVTGLDDSENYSSAKDYANLLLKSLENKKLWEVLSIDSEVLTPLDPNIPKRTIISSNKLIFKDLNILGGKTGYTPKAGGCLSVLFEVKESQNEERVRVISVVLGASDLQMRFTESERLINWIKTAYVF